MSSSSEFAKPEAISVQTAAILLDVHENTIYNWIQAGILVAIRTGPRLMRIPRSEIARLRTNRIPAHNSPQQATTT